MYIYIYIHICICIYIYLPIHTCIYVYRCLNMQMCRHVHERKYVWFFNDYFFLGLKSKAKNCNHLSTLGGRANGLRLHHCHLKDYYDD